MFRKFTGYTLAMLSMLLLGSALIASAINVGLYLVSDLEAKPMLVMSISLLLLAVFERHSFVRVVIRFEAFANNMSIGEYLEKRTPL